MEVRIIIISIIIALAIKLAVDYYIAKEFVLIAQNKGYSDTKKYFWWTFVIFPVGAAMVIALPDLKSRPLPVKPENNEQSRIEKARRDELPDI